VQPQNEKNRNKHAIREDSQSDDLFKKINEDDEEFLEYVDKVKLMVMLRDSLNQFFKNYLHVTDEQRKKLIVYGWLQVGKFVQCDI